MPCWIFKNNIKRPIPELAADFRVETIDCENRCVLVDKRLVYIFRNLLSNAVRYGKAPFVLGAMAEERTGMIAFYVQDYGKGIPAQTLEKLFEPKFGNPNGGWGLGLWFTQMFVQALDGTIEVDSSESLGTRFTFWIPFADCEPHP